MHEIYVVNESLTSRPIRLLADLDGMELSHL